MVPSGTDPEVPVRSIVMADQRSDPNNPDGVKKHAWVVLQAVAVPIGLLLSFLGCLLLVPGIAPGLWYMVPLNVFAGFAILWRRYPRDAYIIGLVYVPIMSALMIWLAALISWHVVGDYI